MCSLSNPILLTNLISWGFKLLMESSSKSSVTSTGPVMKPLNSKSGELLLGRDGMHCESRLMGYSYQSIQSV